MLPGATGCVDLGPTYTLPSAFLPRAPDSLAGTGSCISLGNQPLRQNKPSLPPLRCSARVSGTACLIRGVNAVRRSTGPGSQKPRGERNSSKSDIFGNGRTFQSLIRECRGTLREGWWCRWHLSGGHLMEMAFPGGSDVVRALISLTGKLRRRAHH